MHSKRAGFTIVELVVAVLLFTVGVLGLVATSAAVTQQLLIAKRRTLGSAYADTRFEKLQNSTCSSITAGTATQRNISEHWVVTTFTSKAKSVTDTVKFDYGHGKSLSTSFNSVIPCY